MPFTIKLNKAALIVLGCSKVGFQASAVRDRLLSQSLSFCDVGTNEKFKVLPTVQDF